jgi:hypothetical protein
MSFEKAFINQFLRIILSPRYWEFSPMKLGKTTFSHWDWGRYSAPKKPVGWTLLPSNFKDEHIFKLFDWRIIQIW